MYTFIPVTGQIISRQVLMESAEPGESEQSAESVANAKSKGSEQSAEAAAKAAVVGKGSDAGLQPPDLPTPLGRVVTGGGAKLLDDEDDDDNGEEFDPIEESLEIDRRLEEARKKNKKKSKDKGHTGEAGEPTSKKPKNM